jgi:prefoldin alpha subunit
MAKEKEEKGTNENLKARKESKKEIVEGRNPAEEKAKLSLRKKLQQKYVEMQMIDQQMKQAEQQMMQLDKQMIDLSTVQEAMDDLKKTKDGTELFVPITNGIFAKAQIKDNDNLLVNVGSMTAVPRTVAEVKAMLDRQAIEIGEIKSRMGEQIEALAEKAVVIEQELNELLAEANK